LIAVLAAGLLAPAVVVSAQSVTRDRSFGLGDGWRFMLVNDAGIEDATGAFAQANESDFDDSEWRTVRTPHDWSIELTPRDGRHEWRNGFPSGRSGLVSKALRPAR
jgi:beta-galactosidase